MGFSRGVDIVTDNLMLYIDAGNRRSYPGSGTTVNNLMDNNTGTLALGDAGNGKTYQIINNVDGVSDTVDVSVVRKTGASYSGVNYNVSDNTSFDGRYITFPEDAIYEIRFIERDIRGAVLG